mmetsp:Transcript_93181/g.221650  ORF Transcript_93181/g.221650 Transcript_93181/m.221650 type:complete len:301 (+) Transcript_93181:43-945(+)
MSEKMEVDTALIDEDWIDRASSAEPSRASSVEPSRVHSPPTPGSPVGTVHPSPHGVFLSQPASIDEPLLMLDEEEARRVEREALNEELAEARRNGKADRAAADAMASSMEELEREREQISTEKQRLEKENEVLRLQLQDHHGIMAAEWGQTLQFQERLRQEEAEVERLAAQVLHLQAGLAHKEDELRGLRKDAARWQLLADHKHALEVSCEDIEQVLEVALPAVAELQAECRARARTARHHLRDELEQQLCAVCKDAKKAVLFLPCQHLCVCEGCRGRLRPYRCPMCQEPVQSHISRVHF